MAKKSESVILAQHAYFSATRDAMMGFKGTHAQRVCFRYPTAEDRPLLDRVLAELLATKPAGWHKEMKKSRDYDESIIMNPPRPKDWNQKKQVRHD